MRCHFDTIQLLILQSPSKSWWNEFHIQMKEELSMHCKYGWCLVPQVHRIFWKDFQWSFLLTSLNCYHFFQFWQRSQGAWLVGWWCIHRCFWRFPDQYWRWFQTIVWLHLTSKSNQEEQFLTFQRQVVFYQLPPVVLLQRSGLFFYQ